MNTPYIPDIILKLFNKYLSRYGTTRTVDYNPHSPNLPYNEWLNLYYDKDEGVYYRPESESEHEKRCEAAAESYYENSRPRRSFSRRDYDSDDFWLDWEIEEYSQELIQKIFSKAVLEAHGITIENNIYRGDIDLTGSELYMFPPELSNITVVGNFKCDYSERLITLKNAPEKILGDFTCFNCNIKELEGGPKYVRGHMDCLDNNIPLDQLQYLPRIDQYLQISLSPDKYTYDLIHKIQKLKGIRKLDIDWVFDNVTYPVIEPMDKVEAWLTCRPWITTLKGCPKKVMGAFICNDLKITSLEGAPQEIYHSVYSDDGLCIRTCKQLTQLKGGPKYVEGKVEFSRCGQKIPAEEWEYLPKINGNLVFDQVRFTDPRIYNIILKLKNEKRFNDLICDENTFHGIFTKKSHEDVIGKNDNEETPWF